jgi:hypothetical protein
LTEEEPKEIIMPVPKALRRAARKGGDIGGSPGGQDPLVAYAESVVENSKAPSGLFILEVKSVTQKKNKRGPYLSVTGLAADGNMYWAGLPLDCEVKKGDTVTLKGEFKGDTFGKDGKFHKIKNPEVVGITEKPVTAKKPAKVSEPDAEGLLETLEPLVKAHGIGKILSVLGEIT